MKAHFARRIAVAVVIGLALAVPAGRGASTYAWTAPVGVNTNAATDSGDDWYPQVATDGAGNWVAVWFSDEDLGGTIGTDLDILYANEVAALAGGIAELPEVAATPVEGPDSSSRNVGFLAGVVAVVTAGVVILASAAWYARRRWLR